MNEARQADDRERRQLVAEEEAAITPPTVNRTVFQAGNHQGGGQNGDDGHQEALRPPTGVDHVVQLTELVGALYDRITRMERSIADQGNEGRAHGYGPGRARQDPGSPPRPFNRTRRLRLESLEDLEVTQMGYQGPVRHYQHQQYQDMQEQMRASQFTPAAAAYATPPRQFHDQ